MDFARSPRKLQKSRASCWSVYSPSSTGSALGISSISVCPREWGCVWRRYILDELRLSTKNGDFFGVRVLARVRDGAGCEEQKRLCIICKHRRGDADGLTNSSDSSGRWGWGRSVRGRAEPLPALCLCWDGPVKPFPCRQSRPYLTSCFYSHT